MLTILTNPPVFTSQPSNQTVSYGSSAQFDAAASGTPAPILRWFHNGAPLGSNLFSTVYINNTTEADADRSSASPATFRV